MNLDESSDPAEEPRINGADSLPSLPIYNPAEEFDEFDDEDMDESPRTVLITGASGNLGRKLRAAWQNFYDLVLIDRVADPDDPDVIVADLSELDEHWITHFHGVDTVIHLAANPNDSASWDERGRSQPRCPRQRAQRVGPGGSRPRGLRQLEPRDGGYPRARQRADRRRRPPSPTAPMAPPS